MGHDAMPGLSLREAAQQTGTSKSTILRAIQSGRLSAGRLDDGGYSIDPAELFRVYEPKPAAPVRDAIAEDSVGQDAPADGPPGATELRIRNAELEAQIKALRDILATERERIAEEKRRSDELRAERDRWAAQAERLALSAPAPVVTITAPAPRGWWPWRRAS